MRKKDAYSLAYSLDGEERSREHEIKFNERVNRICLALHRQKRPNEPKNHLKRVE